MAIRVAVDETTDNCDECGESHSKLSPKLWIRQSAKGDRNIIIVHVHCLLAKIAKAMKDQGK